MKRIVVSLAALFCLSSYAYAQVAYYPVTLRVPSVFTLSTTPVKVMDPNQTRQTLSIQNLDSSISICYSFTTTTPVCGAAGTYTITAGQVFFWTRGSVPNNALYMVAASGAPVASVGEGY